MTSRALPEEPIATRLARVRELVQAAARLADPKQRLGKQAREVLPAATGLSREGVALALEQHLEVRPSPTELRVLCSRVPPAPRAHVLLSANVFVGALRAIALALAASPRVEVRPSRREPEMTALLAEAAPGAFRVVEELSPTGGDRVFAYGTASTLASLADELPAGVWLHGYGPGLGMVVLDATHERDPDALLRRAARGVARDVVPFDQRGCASPRIALVLGPPVHAARFAAHLAGELSREEQYVPRGALSEEELADAARYRDCVTFAGECHHAGKGLVGLSPPGVPLLLPPPGRHLHVASIDDLGEALLPLEPWLTAVGVLGPDRLQQQVRTLAPRARLCEPGLMQRPPLDGPLDQRPDPAGVLL